MELAESELESRFLTIEALEARIGELDSRPPTSGMKRESEGGRERESRIRFAYIIFN